MGGEAWWADGEGAARRGRCMKARRFAGEEGQQVEGSECQGVKCEMMAASEPRQAKCRQIRGHADARTQCHLCYHQGTQENDDGRWSEKENVADAQDASPFFFLF